DVCSSDRHGIDRVRRHIETMLGASRVPDSKAAVDASRGDEKPVGREGDVTRTFVAPRARGRGEQAVLGRSLDAPEAVSVAADLVTESPIARAKSEHVAPGDEKARAAPRVPETRSTIPARRGEKLSLGIELDAIDLADVPVEDADAPERLNAPKVDIEVEARGREERASRMPGDVRDALRVHE